MHSCRQVQEIPGEVQYRVQADLHRQLNGFIVLHITFIQLFELHHAITAALMGVFWCFMVHGMHIMHVMLPVRPKATPDRTGKTDTCIQKEYEQQEECAE